MDSKNFKTYLQYLIIKGLKAKKRNINVKGKIMISEKLFNQLKKEGINGRFRTNENLINNLQLELRRYIDYNQYCECKAETFRFRVGRNTSVSSMHPANSSNVTEQVYSSSAFIFAFEFIRHEYTQ